MITKLFRKPFYGLLALLCDRVLAKGTDYESLERAYSILWGFNNSLYKAALFLDFPYPNRDRIKRLINNRMVRTRLRVGHTVDDWRLTTKNPQNKIKDLWSDKLP